jgi:hypothetical protein
MSDDRASAYADGLVCAKVLVVLVAVAHNLGDGGVEVCAVKVEAIVVVEVLWWLVVVEHPTGASHSLILWLVVVIVVIIVIVVVVAVVDGLAANHLFGHYIGGLGMVRMILGEQNVVSEMIRRGRRR